MSGFLPTLWTPDDLQTVQQQLLADAAGVDQTVGACTNLDAPTKASWQAFYQGVKAFGAQSFGWFNTTGAAADNAQALQRELYAWEQKLSTACRLTVPAFDPTSPPGDPSKNTIVQALKYAGILAGFLGTAYLVKTVTEYIPKPSREPRRLPAR